MNNLEIDLDLFQLELQSSQRMSEFNNDDDFFLQFNGEEQDEKEEIDDDEQGKFKRKLHQHVSSSSPNSGSTINSNKKKRMLRKAPDAPKRFKSAYVHFVCDKIKSIIHDNPSQDIKTTDYMKVLANLWTQLPGEEKRIYEKKAEDDKKRYFDEMAQYQGPFLVPNKRVKKDPDAPKRSMSAFLLFCKDKRKELSLQFPSIRNTEMSGKLSKMWRESSEKEKQPYLDQEIIEREKYYERMREYNERKASNKSHPCASVPLSLSCSSEENELQSNKPSISPQPPSLVLPCHAAIIKKDSMFNPNHPSTISYNLLNSFDAQELEFVRSLSADEDIPEESYSKVTSDSTTCSQSSCSVEVNQMFQTPCNSILDNQPPIVYPAIVSLQQIQKQEDPLDFYFLNAFAMAFETNQLGYN